MRYNKLVRRLVIDGLVRLHEGAQKTAKLGFKNVCWHKPFMLHSRLAAVNRYKDFLFGLLNVGQITILLTDANIRPDIWEVILRAQ
ncbi:hypothetical protein CH339_19770 [Rhodobium orientis]|uniref:Uncharacterized protein n=1 Tax=Rhodobium orientis TaxID=34017 RepID=A0A327JIS0_9HYPH|nr:hypothetical protein [Rhodobium orientis]RAI25113.1 hypothetical protein CH339_19770 [Rhodobium orientis]